MKKLLSFTCLAMCACLLASCNPAGTSDTAATQAGVTYADDTNTALTPDGLVTLEPLSSTKTQAPAVTVKTNLSQQTVLVAGICEADSVLTVNGEYTKNLKIISNGVDFVFSVDVPEGKSDTLSITAKTQDKEESSITTVKVAFNGEAKDKELFVTHDSRICQNSILDDLYHTNPFSRNQKTLVKRLAQKRVMEAKKASGKDVQIIYVLVPNPLTIYNGGLPKDMKDNIHSSESCLDQATELLSSVNGVTVLNLESVMNSHKSEKIYYHTDSHWTELGAYYGYEKFCEVKGIAPYTMDQRIERVYEGYKGPFASASAVAATPDTVYAYEPYFYRRCRFQRL